MHFGCTYLGMLNRSTVVSHKGSDAIKLVDGKDCGTHSRFRFSVVVPSWFKGISSLHYCINTDSIWFTFIFLQALLYLPTLCRKSSFNRSEYQAPHIPMNVVPFHIRRTYGHHVHPFSMVVLHIAHGVAVPRGWSQRKNYRGGGGRWTRQQAERNILAKMGRAVRGMEETRKVKSRLSQVRSVMFSDRSGFFFSLRNTLYRINGFRSKGNGYGGSNYAVGTRHATN